MSRVTIEWLARDRMVVADLGHHRVVGQRQNGSGRSGSPSKGDQDKTAAADLGHHRVVG